MRMSTRAMVHVLADESYSLPRADGPNTGSGRRVPGGEQNDNNVFLAGKIHFDIVRLRRARPWERTPASTVVGITIFRERGFVPSGGTAYE